MKVAIELVRDSRGNFVDALPIPINKHMDVLPTNDPAFPWVQVVKGKAAVLFRPNEIRVFEVQS